MRRLSSSSFPVVGHISDPHRAVVAAADCGLPVRADRHPSHRAVVAGEESAGAPRPAAREWAGPGTARPRAATPAPRHAAGPVPARTVRSSARQAGLAAGPGSATAAEDVRGIAGSWPALSRGAHPGNLPPEMHVPTVFGLVAELPTRRVAATRSSGSGRTPCLRHAAVSWATQAPGLAHVAVFAGQNGFATRSPRGTI